MNHSGSLRRGWIAPVSIGLIGLGLSCFGFWIADRADDGRVRTALELRSEWRARDLEAKIRLSGNAVESVAIAMTAGAALDRDRFSRLATRVRHDVDYVSALQWAPRVPKDQIAEFERSARAQGLADYRVFDVTPDFRPTELGERDEYFPILFDARLTGSSPNIGLALGRYEGRRAPMMKARDEGRPVATLPVRPVGPPSAERVYLLFWPVYDGIEVPPEIEARRAKLRGFALGNYNIAALLSSAIRDTSNIIETISFSIAASPQGHTADTIAAVYSPASGRIEPAAGRDGADAPPAMRIENAFTVFDQHWRLTFDFSPAAVAAQRSAGSWGWLLAGIFLTLSLVFYLVRERGRTATIEALVNERTAELQRTSAQLQQAQKMEAIGNLTGGMAHDFNNLLTVVVGNLELLRDQVASDPRALPLIDAATQASLRGAELTRQLLAFARRQPLEPKVTNVNELIVGMTRLLERILDQNIKITLITASDLWPVMIDPAQLNSAIVNLATNARDAMPNGGTLTIETGNTALDADYAAQNPDVVPGEFVLIEVSDTGTGMTQDTLAQAFEPFFTTKEVGQGTGLGLSMAFGFVKQSQGHIKIYSEIGHGTAVRIYLPRVRQDVAVAAGPAESSAPLERAHETVLVVEDNADVRLIVTSQLGSLGYKVVEAENARAALDVLRDPATMIDLLFTDVVMPGGMNGQELARAAVAVRPGLKVLFTSGYSGNAIRDGDRLKEGDHFLGKPYRKDELARKLQEIFKR